MYNEQAKRDIIRRLFYRHGVVIDTDFVNGKRRILDNNNNLKRLGYIKDNNFNSTTKPYVSLRYTLNFYGVSTSHKYLRDVHTAIMSVIEDT